MAMRMFLSMGILLLALTGCEQAEKVEQKAEPGRQITVALPGGAAMEFVEIKPGTFAMGSPGTASAASRCPCCRTRRREVWRRRMMPRLAAEPGPRPPLPRSAVPG